MKKSLLLLLIAVGFVWSAIGQNVNIPDVAFKAYLIGNTEINTNGDTEIQVSEAGAYTGIMDCSNLGISDLTGIGAFTSLTALGCNDNSLTTLNLSNTIGLIFLVCYNNQLTTLDISNLTALSALLCNNNQLTSLNVSNSTALAQLECQDNQLTALDVSSNTALSYLLCHNNQLNSLNVKNGNNSNFGEFNARYNSNLSCIQVDNAEYSTTSWVNKEATTSFSENCGGTSNPDPDPDPSPVNPSLLTGGYAFSLAVCSDGSMMAWGHNNSGQLGDGTLINNTKPVQVTGLSGVTSIAGGDAHSLVIKNDGTVWAWGANEYGQLGNGTLTSSSYPVKINSLTGIIAIAGGGSHSMALKNDGTVWAWGWNHNGTLGNGANVNSSVPVQVTGLSGVNAIAAGWGHSLAVKNDGSVWAWGSNGNGELGNGTNTKSNVPVQVSGLTGITSMDATQKNSYAVKNDGTVWAWGEGYWGQFGNGTNTATSNIPVQVTGLTGITAIAGGQEHCLSLKNDGTVWAWGSNGNGELGNGTYTNSNVPIQVAGLTGITAIAAGSFHSLALKNDGTCMAWGSGQLVNPNNNYNSQNSLTPVQVTGLCSSITAIKKSSTENSISIYPNPSYDFITIQNRGNQIGSSYVILNSTGQSILSGQLIGNTTTLDINGLTSGIYLLLVGEEMHSYKLIKK